MNIKVRLSSVILIIAAFVLVFVSFNSLASAKGGSEGVGDRQFKTNPDGTINSVVPGGPGFISVAGSAFSPMFNGHEWNSSWGYLLNTSSSANGFFMAPITLPHGATVTKFVAYYLDKHTEKNFSVYLMRVPFDNYEWQPMAEFDSDGANPNLTYKYDETIQYAMVDNQSNSYYVRVWLPSGTNYDILLWGIRVDYSFPTYVPLVNK